MAEDPHLLRIFLCHSSGDKQIVRELYQRLRADGFDPWIDEENLLPGQDWQRQIPKAVGIADVVLVCLSRSSITKKGYVQKEIQYALDVADQQPEDTIYLIPLKLEECDIPERLRRWHWVNLFEPAGYERLLNALKRRAISILVNPNINNLSSSNENATTHESAKGGVLPEGEGESQAAKAVHGDTEENQKNVVRQKRVSKLRSIGRWVKIGVMLVAIGILIIIAFNIIRHAIYFSRGQKCYEKKDYDCAVDNFTKVIGLNPKYTVAYYYRGLTYEDIGDDDKATKDYSKAIELYPQYANAYLRRGNIYSVKGNYDEAIKDYSKAIELNSQSVDTYTYRGASYYYSKHYDEAIKDFNKAIELNPQNASVYLYRGRVYIDEGNYDEGIRDCNKAIELNPENPVTYNNRGTAYNYKGNYAEAIQDFNKAIELNIPGAVVYYNRALAYEKLGQTARAKADRQKYSELLEGK
jgi:tetratricopeptide (TPR) repeat protein